MDSELTLEELSRRTGEPEERLRKWRSLGLIGSLEADGFGLEDVERARLIQLLLRRGIGLEAIARAAEEFGSTFAGYLNVLFPGGVGPTYPLAQAAELVGLDLDLLRRLRNAVWLGETGEWVSEEDLEMLRGVKVALEAGFPAEALLEVMRVVADALARVAEAETRAANFYAFQPLKATGLSGRELGEAYLAAAERLYPLAEPLLLYFHRKGLARAAREEVVMNLAEEAGLLEKGEIPGQMQVAIAFVDLSSFTPLTEAMGDLEAARVLERFSALVREATGHWDGRVVKQIGDAFMLVFPEARSALACGLEIEERTAGEAQFPAARSGVHWGRVLYREGDYVGSNVNIAARLASEAERHQVLVSAAVRREAGGLPEVEFVPLGKRRLKGLAEELELFEARPSGAAGMEKAIDPVCRMELGPAEVAARLSLEGAERAFCSEECLRRFVAAPERYGG